MFGNCGMNFSGTVEIKITHQPIIAQTKKLSDIRSIENFEDTDDEGVDLSKIKISMKERLYFKSYSNCSSWELNQLSEEDAEEKEIHEKAIENLLKLKIEVK
jgi:hypothetical protein